MGLYFLTWKNHLIRLIIRFYCQNYKLMAYATTRSNVSNRSLDQRKQVSMLNNCTSDIETIRCGVPQGVGIKHGYGWHGYEYRRHQSRTQGFLLPQLDGQRKRPWHRLVCFVNWLVNEFECKNSKFNILICGNNSYFGGTRVRWQIFISSWRTKVLSK